MTKLMWLKWIALFAGSAAAGLNLGTCITYYILQEFILSQSRQ